MSGTDERRADAEWRGLVAAFRANRFGTVLDDPGGGDIPRVRRKTVQDRIADSAVYKSLGACARVGLVASLLLVGAFGSFGATTQITGALIAQGALVVESGPQKVQHPQGGVVGLIAAREGDRVEAGQVLVKLDETIARANYAMIRHALDQLRVRAARLTAEMGSTDIRIPDDLAQRAAADADLHELLDGERKLFTVRQSARDGERAQLRERILQAQQEVVGYTAQEQSKRNEAGFIAKELEGVRDLYQRKLVNVQRVNQLERDAARIDGDRGQLLSAIARAKGQIAEYELQILQIEQKLRSDSAAELRDTQSKIAEQSERKIAAEDTLRRVEIRAPQSGILNQMTVHTIGGVIQANEVIALVVPARENLVAEVRIKPSDVERIHVGQHATIAFSVLDRNVTPKIDASVSMVGADVATDAKTGAQFFTARLSYSQSEAARLGSDVRLGPGLPVETFITTGSRTFLSYLMKPIVDQASRTFR